LGDQHDARLALRAHSVVRVTEADGNAELLAKIGWQFVSVAVTAIVAAFVVAHVQAAFYTPAK
jgi:hypothetical protein